MLHNLMAILNDILYLYIAFKSDGGISMRLFHGDIDPNNPSIMDKCAPSLGPLAEPTTLVGSLNWHHNLDG